MSRVLGFFFSVRGLVSAVLVAAIWCWLRPRSTAARRFLTESLTTHDEAVMIAPMLRTLCVEHVVLVTSDVHLRRSIGAFRAAHVAHELIGIPYYWARGWWRSS